VDKQGATWSQQGKGWQAWHGWGGDEARSWAKELVDRLDNQEREGEGLGAKPAQPVQLAVAPDPAIAQLAATLDRIGARLDAQQGDRSVTVNTPQQVYHLSLAVPPQDAPHVDVHVAPASVQLEAAPAPVINVAAPVVNVASPTVNVAAPNVTVNPEVRVDLTQEPIPAQTVKITRDQTGRITGADIR
jgi:hypothetical protein